MDHITLIIRPKSRMDHTTFKIIQDYVIAHQWQAEGNGKLEDWNTCSIMKMERCFDYDTAKMNGSAMSCQAQLMDATIKEKKKLSRNSDSYKGTHMILSIL